MSKRETLLPVKIVEAAPVVEDKAVQTRRQFLTRSASMAGLAAGGAATAAAAQEEIGRAHV